MLSRRLIRIKVFKVLYSNVISDSLLVDKTRRELLESCEKTLDLYYFMLNVPVALQKLAEQKIETGLNKFKKTAEDLNPNMKFVNNRFSNYLKNNEELVKLSKTKGLVWNDDSLPIIKKLFSELQKREYFINYMNSEVSSVVEDCNLYKKIFTEEFENNEELSDLLEDMSVYWMDDLGFVLNTIIRNIKVFSSTNELPQVNVFMTDKKNTAKKTLKEDEDDIYAKEDDRAFALGLMDASVINYNKFYNMISENSRNWDPDRIVTTDVVLIAQGLAEAITFPSIPIKVTLNECVEISKFYSTLNSKTFVNGILDRLIKEMMNSGTIVKRGRGLLE